MRLDTTVFFASLVALGACSPEDGGGPDQPTGDTDALDLPPFQELYDQGLDRYLGMHPPIASQPLNGGVVSHAFDGEGGGPLCFTGEPFTMSTRDGAGDELMVFLQGGGACGPTGCDAVERWPPGIPAPVAQLGILSANDANNPTRDFDVAYLPYCDGSLWSGDTRVDADGDGTTDYDFRGLINLTASVDVIADTYPSPSKILLTGNSAGGFGVHHALPLLRLVYPDVPIEMVNDSGIGISDPGGQERSIAYWNASSLYPEGCDDCIGDDGNLTGFHLYQLDEDPDLRMGMMSTLADNVVLERLALTPEEYGAQVVDAMAELEQAHPDRFRSFVAEGDGHTFILRDYDLEVGGTTPRQWIDDLLSGGDWVSVSD